jgi:hypothetical protein
MDYKAKLLNDLDEENKNFEALLAQIGEANMDMPGVAGDWSVKDILAHLNGWRRRTVSRLQAAVKDEKVKPPTWPAEFKTNEEINNWIYEGNRYRLVGEVLEDSRQIYEELVTAAEAFTEDDLSDAQRFPWADDKIPTAEMIYGHFHDEHEADLRKWAEKVKE